MPPARSTTFETPRRFNPRKIPASSSLPIALGRPPDAAQTSAAFLRLVEVVARLRAPDGCPWDREQTLQSIRPYTLEETYEVLEAIDLGDDVLLVEELGDLLLQVVLYAQIAADEGRFDLIPVLDGLTEKLVRRHPHVFGAQAAQTAEQVLHNWEQVKHLEKQRDSVLDGLPAALPALARSNRLAAKAARAGLEWPPESSLARIQEGLSRFVAESPVQAVAAETRDLEFGELLFEMAVLARSQGINPEDSLRNANRRFEDRFRQAELRLAEQGRDVRKVSPEELKRVFESIPPEATPPAGTSHPS